MVARSRPAATLPADELGQAGLDDRALPGVEEVDLRRIDVDADDVVAVVRQTSRPTPIRRIPSQIQKHS